MSASRLYVLYAVLLICLSWGGGGAPPAWGRTGVAPRQVPVEVSLRDVFFVDRLRGWVVGEGGVILHTEDSGESWRRVPSGTTASLERVYFHDRQHGWIVGGRRRRLRSGGYGVVLRTTDGGRTWVQVPLPEVGWLRDVYFLNARLGWACGESTPEVPSGLIFTDNGGITWRPVRGCRTLGLSALAGVGEGGGWAAGAQVGARSAYPYAMPFPVPPLATRGGLASARPSQVIRFRLGRPDLEWLRRRPALVLPTTIRAMQFIGERGWMAGEDGAVYFTIDEGRTWRQARMPWSADPVAGWPIHRLFFRNANLGWAVGRLGGVVLLTTDGGRTWRRVVTANRLPLHGVHFITSTRGYAVGDLGLILRSSDGGRTWRVLQGENRRCSLLVLVVGPGGYPWTALARYAADEGYRTAVLYWTEMLSEPARTRRREALRRACLAVRVSSCSLLGSQDRRGLCEELVRAIRTWLPEVVLVVTDPTHPQRSRTALAAAREAFDRAPDPGQYRHHITLHGLEVWQPRRLVELHPQPDLVGVEGKRGEREKSDHAYLPGKVFAPRLGETYSMVGLYAAEQMGQRPHNLLHGDQLRIIRQVRALPPSAEEHLFRGAYVAAGSSGRRFLKPIFPKEKERAERLSEEVRNLWMGLLLARRHRRLPAFVSAAGQFYREHPETIEGLEALAACARLLVARGDLGSSFLAWEGVLAASRDCPQLPEALHQEVALLLRGLVDPRLVLLLDERSYDRQRLLRQRRAENLRTLRRATERAELLWKLYPSARGIPGLEFRLAAAYRALGQQDRALNIYRRFAAWPVGTIWGCNARCELALVTGHAESLLKPTFHARSTLRPPVLDGKLDDPAWKDAPVGRIPPVGAQPAGVRHTLSVRIAYDEEALYLAFEGRPVGPVSDENLRRWRREGYGLGDLLEVAFDVNRDYATCCRFTLELPVGRGRVTVGGVPVEVGWRCRASLRPDRFVAEWAIELPALGLYRIERGSVWGINVGIRRTDGTINRISGRAPVGEVPAFGYLVFEE